MKREIYLKGEYLKKNPSWHVEDSPWKVKQIIKIMKRNDINPKSICDIGCGAGEILNQLYSRLPNDVLFHGYEISPQAFDLCQQRKKDRLHFHLNDLIQEKAFFDLILVIDVLEHIEDYFGFLNNIRKKSKFKIFHIPLDLSVQSVIRCSPIILTRQDVGHLHYFTKETALATLIDTGYNIIDCFYTDHITDLPRKSIKSLLAREPIRLMYKLNKDMTVRIFGGSSLMILSE